MIVLIAESKTMRLRQPEVSPAQYDAHRPEGESIANEIIWNLRESSATEIMDMLGVSESLAYECRKMIYGFPDKLSGLSAIDAFTGVVFRHLAPNNLDENDIDYAENHMRIVSSLYGILKPSEIIKPYRLDYTAKAAPGDVPLYRFWRQKCTETLLSVLSNAGENEVLDLLPADAARMFDWKAVKNRSEVKTVSFMELVENGKTRTPRANRLKELRGKMLRCIIKNRTADLSSLKQLRHDDFIFSEDGSVGGKLAFLC